MTEVELDGWCARLANEVGSEIRAGRSKKWRCPVELRSRIVAYAQVCRERGEPLLDIATRLGLVESTLARWLRQQRSTIRAGFRSVAIVPSTGGGGDSVDPRPGISATIRLVTPRGYCVEGLDAETLAYLLQVLR